ncbi:MAG: hypothetical protein IPO04_22120 [Cytophagaceae bacterium]|nr:hypothetical protein [Cytophagaceae bacterium]
MAITGNIYNLEYGYLPIKWLVKNLANEIIDSISNSRQINVICSEPLNITASIKSGQCENVSVLYLGVDETVNIGCYALNGNALDESERNVDGQILGNVLPTTDRFNNPNSALYFPGNMNSWVKVFPPLPIQPSFTINAWVYREEGSSYYVLGQGSKDVSTGWFGLICGDGGSQKPGFGVKYGSHNPEIAYAYSDESLQNNQWYMLTGVVDSKTTKSSFM